MSPVLHVLPLFFLAASSSTSCLIYHLFLALRHVHVFVLSVVVIPHYPTLLKLFLEKSTGFIFLQCSAIHFLALPSLSSSSLSPLSSYKLTANAANNHPPLAPSYHFLSSSGYISWQDTSHLRWYETSFRSHPVFLLSPNSVYLTILCVKQTLIVSDTAHN